MQKRETELIALAAATWDIIEITNDDGYEQVKAARIALKNERVEIQKTGKAARNDATKFSAAVIAEEKRLIALIEPEETRLSVLEDDHAAKVERERQAAVDAEIDRQARLQKRVDDLRALPNGLALKTAAEVQVKLDAARAIVVDETFEDKQELAAEALQTSIMALVGIQSERVAAEAEAARIKQQLAELAQLKADAAKRDAEEKERERQAQVARDEETARHAAQLKRQQADAAKEAADRQAIIDANNARIAAEQKAAQDKLDAEAKRQADERAEIARAQEAERARLAAEAQRQIDAQAEIDRQQEALRKAAEPAAVWTPPTPPPLVVHNVFVGNETAVSAENEPGCPCHGLEREGDTCRDICKAQTAVETSAVTPITDAPLVSATEMFTSPTRNEILGVIANFFGVETDTALDWLSQYDWRAALAEAA
jgi:hypothetical protein